MLGENNLNIESILKDTLIIATLPLFLVIYMVPSGWLRNCVYSHIALQASVRFITEILLQAGILLRIVAFKDFIKKSNLHTSHITDDFVR